MLQQLNHCLQCFSCAGKGFLGNHYLTIKLQRAYGKRPGTVHQMVSSQVSDAPLSFSFDAVSRRI